MRVKTLFIVLAFMVFALLMPNTVFAQMVNTNPNYYTIRYDTNAEGNRDSTFIYAFFPDRIPSLMVKSLDSNTADFEWYQFVYTVGAPSATLSLISTESGVTSSQINNLTDGGYLVTVTQGVNVDTFKSWIFIDSLVINDITVNNTCNELQLTADAKYTINHQWYYFAELTPPRPRSMTNNFRMQWSSNPSNLWAGKQGSTAWQNRSNSVRTIIDSPAPLVDAVYTVEMTNDFGNRTQASTTNIPHMAVYADFDVLRPNENDVYSPTTELKGEALYKVKFNNTSVNADDFIWNGYGDQLINFDRDKILWTETTEDITQAKEYRPGQWPVVLTVKRTDNGCTSVTPRQGTILEVDPSSLDPQSIPNAFSPNGDGHNDYFTFVSNKEPVSIEYVDIKIFNRNGLLVYKYNGDAKTWKGWDGRYMGDKGDCATGVYYYIIKAEGWDDINYSGKSLTGTVHLFR